MTATSEFGGKQMHGSAGEVRAGVYTAVAAGILAVLGGLAGLYASALLWLLPPNSADLAAVTYVPRDDAIATIIAVAEIAAIATLLVGGLLLVRRRAAGRPLTATGSILAIVLTIAPTLPVVTDDTVAVSELWVLVFPCITLVLALSAPTAQWLGYGHASTDPLG